MVLRITLAAALVAAVAFALHHPAPRGAIETAALPAPSPSSSPSGRAATGAPGAALNAGRRCRRLRRGRGAPAGPLPSAIWRPLRAGGRTGRRPEFAGRCGGGKPRRSRPATATRSTFLLPDKRNAFTGRRAAAGTTHLHQPRRASTSTRPARPSSGRFPESGGRSPSGSSSFANGEALSHR